MICMNCTVLSWMQKAMHGIRKRIRQSLLWNLLLQWNMRLNLSVRLRLSCQTLSPK